MKVLVLFFCSFLLAFQSNAQLFKKNSLDHLKAITQTYTHQKDSRTKYRKTEYLILFFELGTIGKVKNIHMMSDDENRDSGYFAFKKLTPDAFNEWQSEEFKGKTVVMPVYCVGIEQTQAPLMAI